MATTTTIASVVFKETVAKVSKDAINWQTFLKTASMNYTNSFSEQLLIYAQRPEAVACADINTWNGSYNRFINRGTPGIGLLVDHGNRLGIRYVWGINDTHSVYGRKGKKLKIWKVPKVYEEQVIESLENKFGELQNKNNFVEAIKSVAINLTEDNYLDYLTDLYENKNNTRWKYIDDITLEKYFKALLQNSIAYMILNRSGINPEPFFNFTDFADISLFRDIDSIARLGSAISEISELGIREIYVSLKNIRIAEIDKIRTFDKKIGLVYDDNTKANIVERSDNNDNDLQESRELSSTESNNLRGTNQDGQIWNDEVSVLEESQERNLRSNDNERYFNDSLERDRGNISSTSRNDNERDETETWNNRRIKSYQSNEVGRSNEQHQESSRRNSEDGTNLQLEENENTEDSILFLNDKRYLYRLGDHVFIENEEYIIKSLENFEVFLSHPATPSENRILSIVEFENFLSNYEENNHLLVDYEKDGKDFQTITKVEDITEDKYHVIARIMNDNNCVEFISDEGELKLIIGTKADDESWNNVIESTDWFTKNLTDKEVLDKLEEIFKDNFNLEQENYYGEYNDEIDLIDHVLHLYKIDDIVLNFDENNNLIAMDDESVWYGKSFYNFLFNELFVYNENNEVELIDKKDFERLKDYRKKYEDTIEQEETNEIEEKLNLPTEKEKQVSPVTSIDQLSLFTPIEQELADRIVGELNQLDTKYKGTFYVEEVELKKWNHIKSNKRNLTITIKSDKCTGYNDTSFTVYNTDKTDEVILQESVETNPFLKYLSKDNDFSITLTPDVIYVFYSRFDEKQIDLSVGRNEVLSSINDEENVEIIDNPKILIPKVEKKPKNRIVNYVLHPEIPYDERINYKIVDDYLGIGTPKERYRNNIEAIKIIKKCELEDRYATPEEQEILSKYVGWGGLSKAFKKDGEWQNEYKELKELLNDDEFEKAMDSTLTAFYTPPIVIKSIYKALENMGLEKGNILEPSCGTGNFIGMLPNNDNLKIYGVEKDEISGKIARQLYQKSSIAIKGFEEINFSDSFFDVAVGNVPFGDLPVLDKKYDKNHFVIHDYFFAKTIDKVRPGGVIAFITSKGTMDKEDESVRRYIASRTNLLGAIRLPNNVFKEAAGTTVTSDIIFLQKRDSITDIMPEWVHLDNNEDGITMNKYFVDNPNMILGEMKMLPSQYGGLAPACVPYEDKNLNELLENAISNIHAEIEDYQLEELEEEDLSIEADLNVKNFSYTVIDDKVYYRENSRMYPQELPLTTENRVKGLIEIRECTRELINLQLEDVPNEYIEREQAKLNELYDNFTKKYGLINSRANASAFNGDNSYYLLCSLEILDENGNLLRKADMFSKRTIQAQKQIRKIENSNDALIVSLGYKAKVDIDYMCELVHKSKEEVVKDLEGVIFRIPNTDTYVTADEYLSGNIREKIKQAEAANLTNPIYDINLKYLNEAKPKDLNASEISVKIGTTWIPLEDYEEFMYELFQTDDYGKDKIKIHYSESTNEWFIENKGVGKYSEKASTTYGTKRMNGYRIFEESLNLKDVKVYDYPIDEDGHEKRVLNGKETAIAQAKQEQIKQAFQDWIWLDAERRNRLEQKYNELFNSIKPREYDGSSIVFDGINPEITLRPHQVNAIARILYGGNTLLAHEVGAGKTYEMVAAAMESKRLGLCNKSLFVVPNHIVEQFASEFLQLYPSANILVATKKDFETGNRKKFCSRIATGEYDAVIIGHSQFEKIPMSIERQITLLENEVRQITNCIADSREVGATFTVKQLMKTKRGIETKLAKLNNTNRKDDNVVTFEQLGIDRLFVDEAHYYKNLYLYTKMNNVSGIAQTEAQKSSDLYMKCKYLDEITHNKGIIFATGTPVSNSMVELYTMQRYLQTTTLFQLGLQNFDAWASVFGETTTAIELAPEGTGYRAKTRFAKFYNLPELIAIFKEVADIKTADMLDLPVPEAKFETVVVKPSEIQKRLVEELAERAEKIRGGDVDPHEDNMLKITNDGKKLALDQRLINEMLPDNPNSKANACANNAYRIYQESNDFKGTQLIFCDSSTPKADGSFNVYDDLRNKLIEKGIPNEEIAFIHDADNEVKKKELFAKVRKGQVRILMGSTQKMGAGTNCQDRLKAIHHLDCPWKPAEIVQRNGRGIRQGNMNKEIYIYNYVTEKTFDAYLYQIVENKQKFISQIMTSKTPLRSASDVDETVLSYAEIKALAAGNPLILEKTELDAKVSKLKLLKQSHLSQIYELENKVKKKYPSEIKNIENYIKNIQKDLEIFNQNKKEEFSSMELEGTTYFDRKEAGNALIEIINKNENLILDKSIGHYLGFELFLNFNFLEKKFNLKLKNNGYYYVELGTDSIGNIIRIDNQLSKLPSYIETNTKQLDSLKQQLEIAKKEMNNPFPQEEELKKAMKRLKEVDTALKIDEKAPDIMDTFEEILENQQCKNDYER